jgi:hypothetical protein
MKQRFSGSALVIAGLMSAVACSQSGKGMSSGLTAPTPESAAAVTQRGNGAPAGKLVFKWNLIGTPHDYAGDCGNGSRMFIDRDAKATQITVTNGPDWDILDCNATDGKGLIESNTVSTYQLYVRILGKPGGTLHVCGDETIDPNTGETLCLAGTIDLTRGQKSKFTIQASSLFDATLEDVIWTVDTNSDFKIAQFRIYDVPPQP